MKNDESSIYDADPEDLDKLFSRILEGQQTPNDATVAETAGSALERPGQSIGRYKLLEKIGEGGFGVVYAAQQRTPVTRRVALKIIKPGMDSKQVIGRFEAERQALAMMDHPNIAKVLDAGATESGRPYFVMELVKGISITPYCDQKKLSTRQRLDLFIPICNAIQHAHQKGIIHRDIKPSNILVALHDGVPVPKVIDFGIAKATQQELTDKTVYTHFQQFIGTPAYMSPEQAEMSGLDIDTRSDIYSLGILLYELLTGYTPFDPGALKKAGLDAMRRIIRDQAPQRPSTKLATLEVEALSTTAARHATEAPKLISQLRGDLDWIVMKCLEKDRTRRYETTNGLAMDINRHLTNQPVVACPPSAAYRFRKFARRNKAAIVAVSAVSVALIVGLCLTTIGFVSARAQRDRANRLAVENAERRREAEDQKRRAEYGNYVSRVRLASERLDRSDAIMVARQDLLAAPSDYRNWEWGYLVGRAWPDEVAVDRDKIVVPESDRSVSEFWATAPARVIKTLDHGRDTRIMALTLARDGHSLLTGTMDGSIHLWSIPTVNRLYTFSQLISNPLAAVFSHDDTRLAIGDGSGVLFLFDAVTKTELWSQEAISARPIRGIWFSPDDTRLVAADGGGVVRVFETGSGGVLHTFNEHATHVQSLRFLADGTRVISAALDGSIREWELETGRLIRPPETVPSHGSRVSRVVKISPDCRQVAVGYTDDSIILWDRATDQTRDLIQCDDPIKALVFSHDGTCLFVVEGDQRVRVIDTAGKQLNEIVSPMDYDVGFALSADSTRIVTNSNYGITSVWAPVLPGTDGRRRLGDAHDDLVFHAGFSRDGARIVTASYDKTARVWDADTQTMITEFTGHEHELLIAQFSPDGRRVASVDCRGIVCVWDAETGEEAFRPVKADSETFFAAASHEMGLLGEILNFSAVFSANSFSDNGLVVNDGKEIVVVDLTNGKILLTLADNPSVGWPVIGPHGQRAVTITAGDRNEVHLWDLETGSKLRVLSGHDKPVIWAAFSPDGDRLVTGSMDLTAMVWDVLTGKRLATLDHRALVITARFDPKGERIVTGSGSGTRIWDASTGQVLSTFDDQRMMLTNAEFSPDGTRVLTTARGKTVHIWDPEESDSLELVQFTRDAKLVYGTWSPDGSRILTCWDDGSVHLLEAFPWKEGSDDSVAMHERVRLWREGR